ncbi:MAG: threonylcarbamoyl-AMP synthase [Deltaproteobacteria bacterium]|nr:threonylcarbamoyl-AMP synthase [Deltaproteobacteria bacterium]
MAADHGPVSLHLECTMGEHLYTYIDPPNARHLEQIVDTLRRDGVIAIPTGTSWAFCVNPASKKARTRMVRLKPTHKSDTTFSLICRDISMATRVTVIDGRAYRLLHRLWPGAYTVLLPATHAMQRQLRTKRPVVGIRIPEAPLAMELLERFAGPLLVSTVPADPNGRVPKMGYEVYERFGGRVELVVDLGDELPGAPTTVIDLIYGEPELVREGAGDVSRIG